MASTPMIPRRPESKLLAMEVFPPPEHHQLGLTRVDEKRFALRPRVTDDDPGQAIRAGAEDCRLLEAIAEPHDPRCLSNSDSAITEDP